MSTLSSSALLASLVSVILLKKKIRNVCQKRSYDAVQMHVLLTRNYPPLTVHFCQLRGSLSIMVPLVKVCHNLTECVLGCRAQTLTTGAKDYAKWPTSLCPVARSPFSSPTQRAITTEHRWRTDRFQKSFSTPRNKLTCVHTVTKMPTNQLSVLPPVWS